MLSCELKIGSGLSKIFPRTRNNFFGISPFYLRIVSNFGKLRQVLPEFKEINTFDFMV
jgi:hypothetical protein